MKGPSGILNRHRGEDNIKICLIIFQDIFQSWPVFDTVINTVCRLISGNEDVMLIKINLLKSDVWLTVHRNSVWIRKTN